MIDILRYLKRYGDVNIDQLFEIQRHYSARDNKRKLNERTVKKDI